MKIIVAMSGGVDSSVAAYLLKKQGLHVEGMFMKNWEEDDNNQYCAAAEDLSDAQSVCKKLDIQLHTVNFSYEYWENVFELFLSGLKKGITPNPDILCNKEVKFKACLDYAKSLGADYLATGHYAHIMNNNNTYYLKKGLDQNKDQSYFLHLLNNTQLSQSLFPIGNLDKTEVRNIAKTANLSTHNKKDSTGICFIGERKFKDFLKNYIVSKPGDILDKHENVVGQHDGVLYYTIGQRNGLNIGGLKTGNGEPWYIIEKDIKNNTLIVAQGKDNPLLYKASLSAKQVHWINEIASFPLICKAKTRYRQDDQECIVYKSEDCYKVDFDKPQRAITPGQSVVFYDGDICLGGGIIQ